MPDPNKQTVSATQVAALFNLSPYETRWTLYQQFVGALPWMNDEENERMYWGKKLQPAILSAVADQLRMDVLPNDGDDYLRHPDLLVGCTPDGLVMDPQRGLGWIETKAVDWMVFKDQWTPTSPPPHIVLQHQVQLMIPHPWPDDRQGPRDIIRDPGDVFPSWGIVAALVGGNELHLYEFTPDEKLHEKIAYEAGLFMGQVKGRNEPPVTGDPVELPGIAAVWPQVIEDKWLDLRGEENDEETGLLIAEYLYAAGEKSAMGKWADKNKARLLALAQDCQIIRTTGFLFKISKSSRDARTVSLPDSLLTSVGCLLESAEGFYGADVPQAAEAAINLLRDWREEIAKAGITTRVTAKKFEGEVDSTPGAMKEASYGKAAEGN